MSAWDEVDALKKQLPETPKQRQAREAEETLAAWRAWFKEASGGFWETVEDIEAELGREPLSARAASRDLEKREEGGSE